MSDARELDAQVAQHIFGCQVVWRHDAHGTHPCCDCFDPTQRHGSFGGKTWAHSGDGCHGDEVRPYSTSISAAWDVLTHLSLQWWPEVGRLDDGSWYCEICLGSPTPAGVGPAIRVVAATAPIAICQAVLATVTPAQSTN